MSALNKLFKQNIYLKRRRKKDVLERQFLDFSNE